MKTFILDTNVLLHDTNSLFVFADNEVVVPLCVVEEIDDQKKRVDEIGRNSRHVARSLDELRKKNSLLDGVRLENNGLLRVEIPPSVSSSAFPSGLDPQKIDNQILALALHLKKVRKNQVILVSKDITMRIKADALGLSCQDYERHKVDVDNFYTGTAVLETDADTINKFYADGCLAIDEVSFEANQNITLVDRFNPSHSGIGRYDLKGKTIFPLKLANACAKGATSLWGIKAHNKEQQFAIDMLLDDSLQLVTLIGIAGTGKTLLALAAGLTKVIKDEQYQKLLITRPIIPVGKDIGFLPGDVEAKLMPRMQPISDNLSFLFSLQHEEQFSNISLESLIDDQIIELEALSYIRGRSIPNQFIIVDEAQNLTPHEIKTIITRAGSGTKIVITGDHYQIDNPYLDSCSNGLTYLIERFKGTEIFGHITLVKGERSQLAEIAAEVLD